MKDGLIVRDLRWVAPLSLALGALLALIQPGQWWIGWLAFSLVALIGLLSLSAAWHYVGGGRTLVIIVALAFGLRLLAGVGLTLGLPVWGYDEPQQKAGYVFFDSYRRDSQAWDLARAQQPLWTAFDKSYSTDQYGGLLALSAAVYRYLSPDAHRPLLIILIGALAAALGVPLLWRAARRVWGDSIAWPAVWIFALYPESVLLGSAQMREPFLLTFTALLLWGFVDWQYNHRRPAWGWLAFGLLGILLVSPGIVFIWIFIFVGWYWLLQERRAFSWWVILVVIGTIALAMLLFLWGANREISLGSLSLAKILDWFRLASWWDMYLLENQSGWIEVLFATMPAQLHTPFVLGYGMLQPVLPAALVEPALPLWQAVAVIRAAGWYVLLPFLIYGWFSAFTLTEARPRALWLWLGLAVWVWIGIAAIRAGGDQWDNPRYRVMVLAAEALIAAQGWARRRDGWFARIVAVEGVFLAFFTEWYLSRYILNIPKPPFFVMLAWIVGLSAFILAGGWFWDFWHRRRA